MQGKCTEIGRKAVRRDEASSPPAKLHGNVHAASMSAKSHSDKRLLASQCFGVDDERGNKQLVDRGVIRVRRAFGESRVYRGQ
jgi:hypothetical protein